VSKKDWTTTIPTQELIEMSLSSNENLSSLKDLFEFDRGQHFKLPEHVFYLVCELTWLESSILLILRRDFTQPKFYDKEQKEVIIPQTTLQSLATLNVAKLHALSDLKSFGYSLSVN
jgi:hypothetical protein